MKDRNQGMTLYEAQMPASTILHGSTSAPPQGQGCLQLRHLAFKGLLLKA